LEGPPASASLPIYTDFDNLAATGVLVTLSDFEVSFRCPLGIEHLTGSLAECIHYFGLLKDRSSALQVSKFDGVEVDKIY